MPNMSCLGWMVEFCARCVRPRFSPPPPTRVTRRPWFALALLLVLLQACPRTTDCSSGAAAGAGEVSFTSNSAASDGEFQAPALNPEGWEVKKFEQIQRCLVCRYAQETATGNGDEGSLSSEQFGKLLLRTCSSLPAFLRAPCSDAASTVGSLKATTALSDICHAAKVCSVPLIDPFETAKLLASSCEPSRCTIYHQVS